MSERLEEIKRIYAQANEIENINGVSIIAMSEEDVDWLINRIEELELEANNWRDEAIKWNKRFEESEESHLEVLELLENVLRQNKHYREALKEIARGRFSGASYKARKALEEEI